jgi:YVTN family beta-propeller protein
VIKVLRDFGAPHLAAVAPDGEWAYVTDDARGQLVTIELAKRRVVDRLSVGAGAHHLTISPDERRLWLALGEQARTVVIVDTSKPGRPRVLRRFDPGFAVHDLAFSPDGRQVWLTSADSRSITVVDAHSARRLFTVPAGRPPQHVAFNYAVSALSRFAYITSGYSGRIEMVDARSGRVLRVASAPYGSFNLTTAGGLVVTSSLMRGTLTEFNDRLRLMRNLKVAPAARDVGVVVW